MKNANEIASRIIKSNLTYNEDDYGEFSNEYTEIFDSLSRIKEITNTKNPAHFNKDNKCGKNIENNFRNILGCQNCPNNLQNKHTPFSLCLEIIGKLKEYTELDNKEICVFNLEFIGILKYIYNIPMDKIWFVTDCFQKNRVARYLGVLNNNVIEQKLEKYLMSKSVKKFDIIIGNPPYQDVNNKHKSLWQSFILTALNISKDGGQIALIHPSAWRKPNHELYFKFQERQLDYLEIHNQIDGQKTFNCGTRYDWYILTNTNSNKTTVIRDEDGNIKEINIKDQSFIPHKHSDLLIRCILTTENRLKIIHSRSMYGNDKPWMSKLKNDKFFYPCVYSTPCNKEPNFLYSSKKDGHFGIKKVIIGKASPENCFYDNGKYGVTNNCIAIIVDNEQEANNIIKAIKSQKFLDMMSSCKWSGFSIEPEVFESLCHDFWKEFVNEDGTEKV